METFPLSSITTGVSTSHSAAAWVEEYGTVWVKGRPVVTFLTLIVHSPELAGVSLMEAEIRSPRVDGEAVDRD
jgi:hypothetical protein